jgi:hypothetical protein
MSKKQLVDELHKPVRRNFKRRTVILKCVYRYFETTF